MKVVRFAVVGVLQNAIAYAASLALVWLGLAAWQAVLLLNPISVAVTFFVNRSWSFSGANSVRGQGWKYAAVYAASYLFAISFTWAQEASGVPSWLAIIVTTGIASIAVYLSLSFFVFPNTPETSSGKS